MSPLSPQIRKRLVIPLMGMSILLCVFSFLPQNPESFESLITNYFERQKLLAQEKVYLHTDKPAYASGDTIFLKGYLVDAITHSPNVETNFIYVELLNRKDSVLLRRKFKRTDGIFTGHLELSITTPPGDYYLRSYTEWMRNAPPDYFFSKVIPVGNAVVTDISPKIEYVNNEDGSRVMKIGFFNEKQEPYADESVSYVLTDKTGRVYRNRTEKTNASGVLYVRLDDRSSIQNDPRVDITFNADKYDYQRSFYIAPSQEEYAVTFFPEGGNLLSGTIQTVAFKAQNERGFGEQITGAVVSSKGDTVARINTIHDGMGRFPLLATPGETYRAVVTSSTGKAKEFPLPNTVEQGYALTANMGKDKLLFRVLSCGIPKQDSLFLVAHTRGNPIVLLPLNSENLAGAIDNKLFPDGISQLLLVNGRGETLSRRLVFFYRPQAVCAHTTDKPRYEAREKVELTISVKDAQGNPRPGDYSVSITDGNSIPLDTLSENIATSLLLSLPLY